MSTRRAAVALFTLAGLAVVSLTDAQAGLFGPGKFEIVQADTRFDQSGTVVLSSNNNRISKKSIVGGSHLDENGVYVNPVVVKDTQSGRVLELALVILNRTGYDTTYGSPNTLGILQEIAFAPDAGAPIVLPVVGADAVWSKATAYNPLTHSASKDITESGVALLLPEQLQTIVSAKSVAVRIVGSKRSVTYEPKDLTPGFIANLRTFLDDAVMK